MPDPARAEFLLEVGCEEIPAPWLPGLREQLAHRFREAAEREHLRPAGVCSLGTPRRLVLRADLLTRQPDREEKVWGPSLKAARDPAGGWTSAAVGFARKSGGPADRLLQAPKDPASPSELYLAFDKKTAGRAAADVLPRVIAFVLRALAFPRRMSWDAWIDDGKGAFPFGRPIRWIVALLDGAVVPFQVHALAGGVRGEAVVTSGDLTWGHRFLPRGEAGKPLRAASFTDLSRRLAGAFVILDPSEREARIREALAAAGGQPRDDHGLVAEWRDLVEYPTVVVGRVPAEFRALPTEVLETVLVHHQKYIPLGEGGATSRFAALTNTDGTFAEAVVRGMERVVVARLRDAAFFFAEDRKRPLADRVADLAGVTFHQGLGTYADKTSRLVRLVDAMGAELGVLTRPEHQAAREAARLAKADLTTLMVREFPELQGVMGGIYLTAEGGQWEGVARAVRWHYHPLSIEEDAPPRGAVGGGDATVFGAVSLADKLDSLAGYFGLGLAPTGSSDPYGLRRAAGGAVRVLLDFWSADAAEKRPSLRQLVAAAVAAHQAQLKRPAAEVAPELEAFLLDRLRYVLVARGYPADEVEAVLGAREPDALDDPHEAWLRLKALHRVRSEAREDFEHLAVAFKRAKNILGEQPAAAVDAGLLTEAAERELHDAVGRLAGTDGAYEGRLRALAGLRAPVDRFFDDVLVMAEDERVRANRLGLLSQALSLFYRIADISKLGGQA
ncbi:MAG: glycine--tRNA ligase subunit beta [Acidobacteria bacterium]|nr:MAG: glycine--tRNA ligase subunit beta [Acidobacteriota bacterium]